MRQGERQTPMGDGPPIGVIVSPQCPVGCRAGQARDDQVVQPLVGRW